MGLRRKAREAALQMLYEMELSGMSCERAIAAYWSNLETSRTPVAFANELVRGWARNAGRVDRAIAAVSEHWRLERMDCVDRNILRLATYELMMLADVPARVTLNEAIELAKRFGHEGSAAFVNGVLDRVAAEQGKG
ncbi:MAG: transcription antitermination factor NusB [Proteobacteria bacterium]|nr:transcription antitermination factor NusB [Pseudomonadota bacterium]